MRASMSFVRDHFHYSLRGHSSLARTRTQDVLYRAMDVHVPCLRKAVSPVGRDRELVQHNAVAEVLVIRHGVGERAINRFQRVNVGLRIDADRCRHQQQKTLPLHRDYRPVRPMNQCTAKQSYDSLAFFPLLDSKAVPRGPKYLSWCCD